MAKQRKKQNVVVDLTKIQKITDRLKNSKVENVDIVSKGLKDSSSYEDATRTMLKMVLSAITLAEARYKQNSTDRNAYALNTLVDAARNLMAELETRSARKKVLEVVESIASSESTNLIKQVTMSVDMLRKSLLESLSPKKRKLVQDSLKVFMEEFGKALKTYYDNLVGEIYKQVNSLNMGGKVND